MFTVDPFFFPVVHFNQTNKTKKEFFFRVLFRLFYAMTILYLQTLKWTKYKKKKNR